MSQGRKRRAWSPSNPGNAERVLEVTAALLAVAREPVERGDAVLDVGCGTGWWLTQVAGLGAGQDRLHGVDLHEPQTAAKHLPGAHFAVGDARRLDHPDGRFGLVTFLLVLSVLPSAADRERALREAVRVLAPGGTVAIWDIRWPSYTRGVHRLSVREVRRVLEGAGLEVETRTLTLAPPLSRRLGRATAWLYPALAALPPLRSHRLTVGRRPAAA